MSSCHYNRSTDHFMFTLDALKSTNSVVFVCISNLMLRLVNYQRVEQPTITGFFTISLSHHTEYLFIYQFQQRPSDGSSTRFSPRSRHEVTTKKRRRAARHYLSVSFALIGWGLSSNSNSDWWELGAKQTLQQSSIVGGDQAVNIMPW